MAATVVTVRPSPPGDGASGPVPGSCLGDGGSISDCVAATWPARSADRRAGAAPSCARSRCRRSLRRRARIRRGRTRSIRRRCPPRGRVARSGPPAVRAPRRRRTALPPAVPLMTSGGTPIRFSTPAAKLARLATSRLADVATNRILSTPSRAITSAYSSSASNVRSRAAAENCPVRSTPSPSRTIRIRRACSTSLPSVSSSATRRRTAFVPQSIAATGRLMPSAPTGGRPPRHTSPQSTTRPAPPRPRLRGGSRPVPPPGRGRLGRAGT